MLEHFARSFKAGIGRPALVTAYYNDIHGNVMGKSAAAACYRSPHLDGVVSCNPYGVSRRAGGSGGNGSSASIGLHGKYHLQEQDYRTEYSYIRIKGRPTDFRNMRLFRLGIWRRHCLSGRVHGCLRSAAMRGAIRLS